LREEIIFEKLAGKKGDVGLITLNRPEALNALTYNMCQQLNIQLTQWEQDEDIKAVIIQGNGERAFCAGGDIRKIYTLGQSKDYTQALAFFAEEYKLNEKISNYTKPYIALMNGITMGGGMGISIHASHRVATEKTIMAMPETGIGFFPDIGASYFLSRCSYEIGTYLALTGLHINAADAAYIELVDALVSSTHCQEIIDKIVSTALGSTPHQAVTEIINGFAVFEEITDLRLHRESIAQAFSQPSVEAIIAYLKNYQSDWHEQAIQAFANKSPTSLKVTLAQLRRGVALNLKQCLEMEYRMAAHFLQQSDFYEGVRALLIDKDKSPQWSPGSLDKVSAEMVACFFE
tara:strand:+ start:167 stop:1207 length:1041 start_codon:yes stop_codon:yes gene_type:complete